MQSFIFLRNTVNNILVTDGVGFVGTNLVRRLLSDGHTVHSIDNYSAGKTQNHIEGDVYHHSCTSEIDNVEFEIDFEFYTQRDAIVLKCLKRGWKTK